MVVANEPQVSKKSYTTLPVANKRVLVRVDFNVPIDKEGNVTDDSRIRAALPTLEYLVRQKAKIIIISHLGRPKGQPTPKYSLKPTVNVLSQYLKVPVAFVDDCIGSKVFDAVAKLQPGQVLLLENLRFHAEEEKNNPVFGKELASIADYFIQDAFGAVHRAHASTASVPSFLPSAAGALLERELRFLTKIRSSSRRPFLAVLGGAKVVDKIGVVEALLQKVDSLFIGGAMAYTFLKAKGVDVGDSRVEPESIEFCKKVLTESEAKGIHIYLPQDHLVVKDIENSSEAKFTTGEAIESGWKGVDIGPKTIKALSPIIKSSKTIFWNGPTGIFEIEAYSNGTMTFANLMAETAKDGATVVIGGGDSVAAVVKAGVADQVTFISTGGGASLEFLEGKELPGVKALPEE